MSSSTLSSWALLVWEELRSRELDADGIFRQAGLDPARLGNAVARFPVANMLQLWRLARNYSADAGFGIAVGARWNSTSFHALGFAWLASGSLGEALHRMSRYGRFLNDSLSYQLVSENVLYRFRMSPQPTSYPEDEMIDVSVDAAITALLKMCRLLMSDSFSPIQIQCPHPPNGASVLLEQFARCPVHYGEHQIEMLFSRQDIERMLSSGNEELSQVNEQIILKHMAGLARDQLSARVQLLIFECLPSGNIREQDIAEQLGIGKRTMQRRLLDEGSSYQQLLQVTRRKLADQYIRDERLAISEIAYLLGFSEQANFSRAFRRWYGVSPSEYRAGK